VQAQASKQEKAQRATSGLLNPIDRNAEILFGLFMVLTFTGTLSAATAGREEVRTMLVAAIGCNAAWGLVDGVMYILRNLVTRGRRATLVREVRAASPDDGHRLIADEMGELSSPMTAHQFEHLRQWMLELPASASLPPRVLASDVKAACGVFVLVFMSTFPVVLPFMFVDELRLAMRLSSLIAISMMFLCGYAWARYAGVNAWGAGLAMVLLGVVVEAIVILLGG
jgi:VIT family